METPLSHNKLFQKMCLYQIKLRNPKYLTNEKNLGNIPIAKDRRHLYINTDCGWCKECRKKIANEWRNRLQEEYYGNRNAQFITLSFSPEGIQQLEREIYQKHYKGLKNTKELDVNILAAYAIRMWSERWRKKYKKAPKHWLITELGHKNSERLHLHGIQWTTEKQDIERTWQYGNVYIGKYVNERSFAYITKYITKLDQYHKGYKQRIFTSKKIGIAYIESKAARIHEFKFEKTILYYRNHQGIKFSLCRYWKNKLFTEEQREFLWSWALDQPTITIDGVKYNNNKENEEIIRNILKIARRTNEETGFGTNTTTNRKYIITELMKMNTREITNYNKDKLVKCVERRHTEKITQFTELCKQREYVKGDLNDEKPDKSLDVDLVIYGDYKGNLTKTERKYNKLLKKAREQRLTVRQLRLKEKGLPYL